MDIPRSKENSAELLSAHEINSIKTREQIWQLVMQQKMQNPGLGPWDLLVGQQCLWVLETDPVYSIVWVRLAWYSGTIPRFYEEPSSKLITDGSVLRSACCGVPKHWILLPILSLIFLSLVIARYYACLCGHEELVRYLLANGEQNYSGYLAPYWSVGIIYCSNCTLWKLLL